MASLDDIPMARPFTGMALDRAMIEREDPAWVTQQLEDAESRVLLAAGDGVLLSDGAQPALVRTGILEQARVEPILLGMEDGSARFAVDYEALSDADRAAVLDGAQLISLRDAGETLPRAESALASYVTALLNWHRRHHFCANCGAATTVAQAGYSRECPSCGASHFPRTDPVVIMAVDDGERLLLGHRAGWGEVRYSVLAGFISPGESAEEAVLREVEEESGIIAREPRFVTSQPWPFPASLMLGFEARSDGGEPAALDDELDDVRWFTRDQVRAGLAGHNPQLLLPPSIAIARFLIERFVARGD